MPLGPLQHYTIEPSNLTRTKKFYCEVLGLENGDRPPLGFPGYWLYSGGVATVHLLGPRKPREGRPHTWAMWALGPLAFVLGFYDGFFGPGVGSMLIVMFVVVFGDTLTRATAQARGIKLQGVRRVTLSRIRYYVYYRATDQALEVLAFWHTSRGRQPPL